MPFRVVSAAGLAAAILLVDGCSYLQRSSPDSLSRGDWRAVEIDGNAAAPADVARRPWIHFFGDSARVAGSGGCNRLAGSYTVIGPKLQLGQMTLTRMACADNALNAQETAFTTVLLATDHFRISRDTLILMQGTATKARLVR